MRRADLSGPVRSGTTGALAVMFASGQYRLPVPCALVAASSGAGAFSPPRPRA
ncbi:hypothetical protein EV385_4767 [Krasilnikovia cinnamomea]|uniref:Uncharacterized protein n=1 Tax=Krasilnikovia cinnamomea TaxID=349313 RepID=A0A4Q7ZQR2_9ACTN|nr:hypothetical protein [Krasilnikovia cinnamomea]RZU52883.1 hypothetical protein EV385_4767 [Krasilnikovia cinnamomea]